MFNTIKTKQMGATVNFYTRNDAVKKNGKTRIYLRITIDRKIKCKATDIFIHLDNWNIAAQKVNKTHPLHIYINNTLSVIETRLYKKILDFEENNIEPTFAVLFDTYKTKNKLSIFEYADNNLKSSNVCEERKLRVKKAVDEFMTYAPDATFNNVDCNVLEKYRKYLQQQNKAISTVTSYMVRLKYVFLNALKEGVIKQNPFAYVKVGSYESKQIFITKNEVETLQSYLDNKAISIEQPILARFLFSCYTGLRFGDTCKITYENIKHTDLGKYIIFNQNKTSKDVIVPLSNKAIALININCKQGLIFGEKTNQYINRSLKTIGENAGIKTPLKTHVARHSFITISQELGMSIVDAGRIAGHANVKTTQGYTHYNLTSLFKSMSVWDN